MLHYEFPEIRTVDDLRPAFEDREEIKLMDRGDYDVVDYLYVLPDTFPEGDSDLAKLRRECRGILFNKDGTLLSRRLHKFFNMGERESTLPEAIDFSRPHHILNKEDGSMVSPYMDPQEHIKWVFESNAGYTQRVFWGTMMGWTDVAQDCEEFISQSNCDYDGFARMCLENNWTPIFEWCSPNARIVLKHDRAKLVLLAVRHNTTGAYRTYEEVCDFAESWGIPVVESFGRVDGGSREFMEKVHGETNIEGYVVQFDSGHCVKLKTSWYLRFHKAKENLVFEKDVWNLILAGDTDDVKPVLMDHDRERLEEFEVEFEQAMEAAARHLIGQVNMMKAKSGDDRGAYAALVKSNDELHGPLKGMAFKLYQPKDGVTQMDLIRQFAENSVGSASKIEEARKIIGVNPW